LSKVFNQQFGCVIVRTQDDLKKEIGRLFLSEVKDGMVLGLGTGSTANHAIIAIGDKIKNEKLKIYGIPTSYNSRKLGIEAGIIITTLENHKIDIAFDGADEIDPSLNLIKGRGGAMTNEKIVDSAAKRFIVLADESKLVKILGESRPIPIEVAPDEKSAIMKKLEELGAENITLRHQKQGPVITDMGNMIIDANFSNIKVDLEKKINSISGVIDNGLFFEYIDFLI